MSEKPPLEFAPWSDGFSIRFAQASVAYRSRILLLLYLQGQIQPGADMRAIDTVLGELLGNVVRHAPGPVEVRVVWLAESMRLEIVDEGPGYALDPTLPEDPFAESHRGLFIVGALGTELRVERRGTETVTSVKLRAVRERALAA